MRLSLRAAHLIVPAVLAACGGSTPPQVSVSATPTVFVARVESARWRDVPVTNAADFNKVEYGTRELSIDALSSDGATIVRSEVVRANAAGYVIHALPAGRYEISRAFWGDKQSQCFWICNGWKAVAAGGMEFNERVVRFEIVPGRINYAGTLIIVSGSDQRQETRGKEKVVVTSSRARLDQLWDDGQMQRDLALGAPDLQRLNRVQFTRVPSRKK